MHPDVIISRVVVSQADVVIKPYADVQKSRPNLVPPPNGKPMRPL